MKKIPFFLLTIIIAIIPDISPVLAKKGIPASFDRIDAYALNAAPRDEATIKNLAAYLSKGAQTDSEKARAMYRWITDRIAYDVELGGKKSFDASFVDPPTILIRRRTVCIGYANLFKAMAEKMGLKAEVVGGINHNNADHAWNAVMIGDSWRLLDATFGSGIVQGSFKKGFSSFYFLTPPEQFILDHFPSDAKWQLLQTPWTREEWSASVRPFPAFFDQGLTMNSLSEKKRLLMIDREKTITITGYSTMPVEAQLFESKSGTEVQIACGTLVERNENNYSIKITPPATGAYTLKIRAIPNWLVWYQIYSKTTAFEWTGFPCALPQFVETGGHIIAPLSGVLPRKTEIDFIVILPGLKKVFISVGGGRIRMERDTEGVYRAKVRTPDKAGLVEVQEQPEGKDWFNRILIYNVK